MNVKKLFFLSAPILIVATLLEPLYALVSGPEWAFTSPTIIKAARRAGNYALRTKAGAQARDRLLREVLKKCKECSVRTYPNRYYRNEPVYRVQFKPEIWIDIDIDPWIVEVTASPLSREKFVEESQFFSNVFEAAENAGLSPHHRIGGGHINLDFETAFGDDESLARDFIVDLINHPELAMGLLGKDYLNGAPMSMLDIHRRKIFVAILKRFDAKEITFDEFIEEINVRVYDQVSPSSDFQPVPPAKYQGVNLLKAKSTSRPRLIELRFLRPQKNFEDYLNLVRLFEARIFFLKGLRSGVLLNESKLLSNPNVDASSLLLEFENYIREANLNPVDFYPLLRGKFKRLVEGTKKSCLEMMEKQVSREEAL